MTPIDWNRIHERSGFSAASLLLTPLSALYGTAVRLRMKTFGKVGAKSLPGFVVSIGNLTVGGTGKTPAACMLAEWALREGYRVAVLSRGYGGHYREKVLEVSDGHGINATPAEAGDEPYLMARRLPGVPVIVARKRYLAGIRAHERHGTDFFVLDDGFQHLALKRDFDLVLMDAANPFGNGHLLPWGPLREPFVHFKRADAFVLTRSGHETAGGVPTMLNERFPGKPLFYGDHSPKRILFPFRNEAYDPQVLEGKRVAAFAGIARPEAFHDTLRRLGAEVVRFKAFRDHHLYTPAEVQDLILDKERHGADWLITTEKDWVRVDNLGTQYSDLAYLEIVFTLLSGSDAFYRIIRERSGPAGG